MHWHREGESRMRGSAYCSMRPGPLRLTAGLTGSGLRRPVALGLADGEGQIVVFVNPTWFVPDTRVEAAR